MFETSKDILYIVIAFCVLWVTFFVCWMFFYLAKIFRDVSQVVEEFRVKLEILSDAIHGIKRKVEMMHGLMGVASGGVADTVKKMMIKKTKKAISKGTRKMDKAAKEAVEKAVVETEKKIKAARKKTKKRTTKKK